MGANVEKRSSRSLAVIMDDLRKIAATQTRLADRVYEILEEAGLKSDDYVDWLNAYRLNEWDQLDRLGRIIRSLDESLQSQSHEHRLGSL